MENQEHTLSPYGWIRLWHPAGIDVRLPLPVDRVVDQSAFTGLLQTVSNALAAGWLTQAPGLEEGEEKQEVGYVVHKVKNNEDGTDTDVVDLYANHDGMKFSVLTVYLNTEEDCRLFERASGMKLDDLPVYVGNDKIERGKSRQSDKFVIKAPKPFFVAHKANPRYSEEDHKRAMEQHKLYPVPRRKFSSWPGVVAAPPESNGQPATTKTNGGPAEPMLRTELQNLLRQLATVQGITFEQSVADFCRLGKLKTLADLPADRLDKACEHTRKKLADLQTKPTLAEIGKLPAELVGELVKTLETAGLTWNNVRAAADTILGRPLENLTLDDVAKIDNWIRRQKKGGSR